MTQELTRTDNLLRKWIPVAVKEMKLDNYSESDKLKLVTYLENYNIWNNQRSIAESSNPHNPLIENIYCIKNLESIFKNLLFSNSPVDMGSMMTKVSISDADVLSIYNMYNNIDQYNEYVITNLKKYLITVVSDKIQKAYNELPENKTIVIYRLIENITQIKGDDGLINGLSCFSRYKKSDSTKDFPYDVKVE